MDFESPKNNDTLSEELNPEEPKVLDNNYLTNKLGHIGPNFNNEIVSLSVLHDFFSAGMRNKCA